MAGKKYKKADEVRIEGNKIFSPVRQKWLTLTPEEQVRQQYVEAGYALKHHEQNRLIYLFEPQDSGDRVPFDLNTFKYVQISQAAEIQGRLLPEIKAILEDAGAVLERETT